MRIIRWVVTSRHPKSKTKRGVEAFVLRTRLQARLRVAWRRVTRDPRIHRIHRIELDV